MRLAQSSGQRVEVSALTTETQQVFADPQVGGFVADISAVPARTKQPDGSWRGVDLTLVRDSDGSVRPVNAAVPMSFSGGGSDSPIASIEAAGKSLGIGWPHALPAPVLEGQAATYRDVLPGVDLVAKVGVEGFGTYLVVKDAAAAKNPALATLSFPLRTGGVTATASTHGLVATDGEGVEVFRGGSFRMWDAKGGDAARAQTHSMEGQGAAAAQMPTRLSGSELVVEPDLSVLRDPATVYPVVIDPSVSTALTHSYWVMVWSNGLEWYNSSTEHARVGYDGWSSAPKVSRVFYNFSTGALYNKEIYSAKLAHKLVHSPNNDCSLATYGPGVQVGVTGGISSSTVWPGPSFLATSAANATAHGHSSYCSGYDRVEWDVKSMVQTYAADSYHATLTFGMKSSNEGDRNGWRQFDNDSTLKYPNLTVVYFSHPNKASRPTVDGAYMDSVENTRSSDTTPTVRSTVSDPDPGSTVKARFEFWTGSTKVATYTSSAVASGNSAAVTLPTVTSSSALKPNTEYVIRVWAIDDNGFESLAWSDFIRFTVDTIAPAAPTVSSTPPASVTQTGSYQVTISHSSETDIGKFCWAQSAPGLAWTPGSESCVNKASSGSTTSLPIGPFTLAGDYYDVHVFAKDLSGRNGTATKHTLFVSE